MLPFWLRRLLRRAPTLPHPPASARPAPRPARALQRVVFEELEPRLLYAADSLAAWLPSAVLPAAVVQVDAPALATPPPAPAAAVQAQAPTRELVFIDAAVQPTQALLDGLLAARPAGVQLQVVLLHPGSDGLQQISATLAQHSGLSAVHIVAHGEQAALKLGSSALDTAALVGRGSELKAWAAALADDADLLLYGCDVAAGDMGAAFIQRLAGLTGADVAASTNATGATAAGGDWVLEAQVGTVTAQAAAGPMQQAYAGVLGLQPAGVEVRVNSDATGIQNNSLYGGGNVAVDASGRTVLVWNDMRTNGGDIYLQRYDAAGVPLGSNTLVNTTTANQQDEANVAMDGSGNFVVVWASDGQDGSGWGIYGQRFDAAGNTIAGEFQVNTTTASLQHQPTVSMSAAGDFVVAWSDQSSGNNDIRAQRFNAGGAPQGGEFVVNSTGAGSQQFPSAAMAAGGTFVVMWEGDQSGDYNVYGQRYSAAGVAQGAEFQVNTNTTFTQWNVAVATDGGGNFVAAWDSAGQDPDSSSGIYAQRYNASGVPQGTEFRVNSTTANTQQVPSASMNGVGAFVISWTSIGQDGSGDGVYAQAYDAAGATSGGELRLSGTTLGNQQLPSVAYAGTQVVASWSGNGSGDSQGVFVRQLQVTPDNRLVVGHSSDVADGDTSSITALINDPGADGAISLREAITAANNTPNGTGPDRIEFDISGAGPHTIVVGSALPTISDAVLLDATTNTDFANNGNRPVVVLDGNDLAGSGLTLAATADGSTIRGLVIRDFAGNGIHILAGSDNHWITGNYLGSLTASGTDAGIGEANAGSGIYVASGVAGTVVGGSGAGQGNVLSGNQLDGLDGLGTGMVVQGNFVGTDASGTLAIGNAQDGISLADNNNLVGGTGANEGNLIAFNARHGIDPWTTAIGNSLLGNRIFGNGGLAIDLALNGVTANDFGDADTGANNLQNFPVLATARSDASSQVVITGALHSVANSFFRVEFFANTTQDASGYGEGETYLGFANVATDGSGNAAINTTLAASLPVGRYISATATRATDGSYTSYTDTSEFARSVAAVDSTQAAVAVDTASDVSDGDTSTLSTLLANKGADGYISLREAITAANNTVNGSSADRITFNIAGTGVHLLMPLTALPTITDAVLLDATTDDSFAANGNRPAIVLDGNDGAFDGLVLGPTADGSSVQGLVLRDFGGSGLWVQAGSDNHTIAGNYIGALDAAGQWAVGEGLLSSGLFIEGFGTTVGGTSAALRNVIAGAGQSGIWLQTGAGNTVLGNTIGLAADDTTIIGNGFDGITITTGSGNRIGGVAAGEGNRIAGSADDGIEVNNGTGNALLGNTIAASGSLAIDLGGNDSTPLPNDAGDADVGGNNLQNHPVLATARTDGSTQLALAGTLDSLPSTAYRIEFFANAAAHASGHGEAQRHLGYVNVTTDAGGLAAISASLGVAVAAGESISATATRANPGFTLFSDSSELAQNVTATLAPVVATSGTPVAYTENDAATPVDAALALSDGDSTNLVGATVSITANFSSGQDVLAFSNQLGITGSYNAGTGVLTLSGSAPVADYQAALRSVSYANSSNAPSTLTRSISFVVNDGTGPSVAASRDVTVAAVNDAPVVGTTGSTLTVSENDAATAVDTGLTMSDADHASLSGATVAITAGYVAGQDLLLFTNQLGINGSWNAGTGVLTLSGTASVADYQTALRSVGYLNSSEAPTTALRTVSIDASDGLLTSTAATRNLQVNAVNDAPVLDNSGSMLLSTIGRTDNTNPGNTVAQVIGSVGGDHITDVDAGALEGVALTATTTGGIGQWQYSLDGGTNWLAVGTVNTNAALLLRDTDRVRFVPNGAANGQGTLTFRAWDQTSGSAGTLADVTSAGGTQPASAAFETATVNVVETTGGSVAVADNAQTPADTAVAIAVLGNDLDPQGDSLAVLDVSNPANGSVAVGGGGVITYTPTGGTSGTDSFSYRLTDGNEGLTNYWKLDGNAADSVGTGSGTLMNGPTTVAGPFGQALQFDGVDDHVALPDVVYSNEFSLSFRFRVDDNSGNQIQYFYSHGASPASGQNHLVHVALVENNNAVLAQRDHLITTVFDGNDVVDGAGQLLVNVAPLIGDGQWHQYTATVTPGIGTQVYIDGVLQGSVNRGGDAMDPTGGALLGARSDLEPTRYLNAGSRMDSLALFNRALSHAEVADFYSGGSKQASVTVSVNAAPVVATTGGNAGYTENGAATAVDAGLTVTDANSANLTGATVSIGSNYTLGQDELQFSNQLGITGSWNVGTGELTLSGTASVASYETALRSVTYVNSSDAPSTALRGVQFVVSDGLVTSSAATRNLVVTAVNDAATASNLNAAETYTEDTVLDLTDTVVSDVDSTTGVATLTLSNAAAGVLSTGSSGAVTSSYNAGTGVWTASGALLDVNALLAAVTFTPAQHFNGAFSIATSAGDGVAAPATGSRAFTGLAVNDAPTASNLGAAQSYTEDQPLNLTPIVVTDVDSANVTVTLTLSDAAAGTLNTGTAGAVTSSYGVGTGVWSASGALADVNSLLAALVFTPATNHTSAFSIATSVSDGVAAPVTGNKAMAAALVNDAPTAFNLNAAENYIEDTALDLTDIVVSDVDSASVTATLTLSNATAAVLSTGTAGAVTASYNASTGVWTASGALADVNTLLAAVTLTPAADFNGAFSLATSVSDGVAAPVTGSKAFTGVPVNDAPTASNLNAAETYTEDTPLNLVDVVVADIDSSGGSVTLTLSNPAAGALSTGSAGAVSASYEAGTGVWSASGDWADVNLLLAALSFTPAANFNGAFSLATSVSDGVAAAVTGSKAFTGVPVNDAPTATNLDASETYVEDTALDLTDIVIGDVDSANVTATLTLSNTAVGALSTGTAGAVSASYNPATGVWLASGARADVNSLLATLQFVPAADFNGSFVLNTQVSDGVAAPLLGSKAFTGVAVNDAPVASNLNTTETYTEDTVLNLADTVVSDVDHSSGSVTLTLSDPSVGVLSTATAGATTASYNAATGVWSASGLLVDVNTLLAGVSFTPALNGNGGFSLAISVGDGVAAPVTGTRLFTGVASNDGPTASNLSAAESYTEDLPLDLADITVADVDSATVTVTLSLQDTAAGALSTGTAGAVTSTFNASTGVWAASGAQADVNALLAALVFSPAADFNAGFSIATRVSDGVAPVVTGLKVFSGAAVNDAPTAIGLGTSEVYTEDTALDLSAVVIGDIDSAWVQATLRLSDAAVGALGTASSGAVVSVFDAATGTWSASGARADVNALLAAVRFTPALNFNGAFAMATTVSDGVAAPLTGTKLVTGVAVNDAPVLAFSGPLAVAEGSLTTLGAAQLQASDVDHGAAQLAYTLQAAPAHGALLRDGVALAVGDSFTQADLDAGRVAYRHDGSETTADLLDLRLGDGLSSALAAGVVPISVQAVNDEVPVVTSPGPGAVQPVPENTHSVTRVQASDADLPAQALRYEIAGGADAVFFSVDATTGDLRFVQPPDFEQPLDQGADNQYQLTLRVSDGTLFSTHDVVVAVLPENDNVPLITSSGGAAQGVLDVREGGVAVLTLTAGDADQPPQPLAFAIVGGSDAARFVVDASTGALRFVDAPLAIDPRDADRDNLYDVVVQASDGRRVVQQALKVQVRASQAGGMPSLPPAAETPAGPPVYTGGGAATAEAAPPALRWPDMQPVALPETDPVVVWAGPGQDLRAGFVRLENIGSSRAVDPVALAAAAQALAAETAGDQAGTGTSAVAAESDTPSLEAALGLPTVDPDLLQARPGGLSLAALAAQTAARSSTSVPGQLFPVQSEGNPGGTDGDGDTAVEVLARPVVAGGMAVSATLLVWATRAGGLVAAMMASVPAWRTLDPLPILERAKQPDDDEGAEPPLPALAGAGPISTRTSTTTTSTTASGGPLTPPPMELAHGPAPLRDLIEPLEMLR